MSVKSKSKPQPEAEIKQLTLRLPLDGWKRLAHLAVDEDISIQAFIVTAINAELTRRKLPTIKVSD